MAIGCLLVRILFLVTCTSMWMKCQKLFTDTWLRGAKEAFPSLYR